MIERNDRATVNDKESENDVDEGKRDKIQKKKTCSKNFGKANE